MTEFSPADAALEGFRVGRENPVGLLVWGGLYAVASIASGVIMVRTGSGEAMARLMETAASAPPDPAAVNAAMAQMAPGFLLGFIPLLVAQLLIQAGVLRIVLRPEEGRRYLGLGADEMRVTAAFAIVLAATLLVLLALSFVLAMLSALLAAAGAMLGFVAGMAAWIYVSTRLALIYPLAIAEGRVSLPEAWRLTQGRFAGVFGAQVLAFVFFVIVGILGGVIAFAVRAVGQADPAAVLSSVSAMFAPAELAASLIEAVLQAMGLVLMTCPAAAIYRAITPRRASEVF